MKNFEKMLDKAASLAAENEKNQTADVTFSKEHEEKMKKLFEMQRKAHTKTAIKIASLAACVVVAFFVVGNIYPQKNTTNMPQAISGEDTRNDITVQYIPQGFEEKGSRIMTNVVLLSYKKDDLYFRINVNAESVVIIDNTNIKINDYDSLYSDENGIRSIVWSDGERAFSVTGNVSKEELIKIAEGVKHK